MDVALDIIVIADRHSALELSYRLDLFVMIALPPLRIRSRADQALEPFILNIKRILFEKLYLVDSFFDEPPEYGIDYGQRLKEKIYCDLRIAFKPHQI